MRALNGLSLRQRTAVPLILMATGLITACAFLVASYWDRVEQARGMAASAKTIGAISDVIHETQKERAISVLYLNEKVTRQELEAQRFSVGESLKVVLALDTVANSEEMKRMEGQAEGLLRAVRDKVDSGEAASTVAKEIGDVVDAWIKVQVAYANKFHLDGLESNLTSASIFEKSKESMGRLRALLSSVLAANQPIEPQVVSLLSSHKVGILASFDSPGMSISDSGRQAVRDILASNEWTQVTSAFETVVESSRSGNFGKDANAFSATITSVVDDIRGVIHSELLLTTESIRRAESRARESFWICVCTAAAVVAACLILAFMMAKSISESLTHLSTRLSSGANEVSLIASKIETVSQQLSASSSQQAAAMQETTAAVTETSEMIKRNAANAISSTQLSERSQASALQGQQTIRDMIDSIEAIGQSMTEVTSQVNENNAQMTNILKVIGEIGSKTKVINEIVFQTKLLSFNASVEAARAGEQGKGFAVVAEEVGGLARMSGAAATEITDLLERSILEVDSIVRQSKARVEQVVASAKVKMDLGTSKANMCGATLNEIIGHISQVGSMVNDIAQASQEQSKGIEEISRAMVELDQSAQQNSNVSQGSSESSANLKVQVDDLEGIIHQLLGVVYGAGVSKSDQATMPDSQPKDDVPIIHSNAKDRRARTAA